MIWKWKKITYSLPFQEAALLLNPTWDFLTALSLSGAEVTYAK